MLWATPPLRGAQRVANNTPRGFVQPSHRGLLQLYRGRKGRAPSWARAGLYRIVPIPPSVVGLRVRTPYFVMSPMQAMAGVLSVASSVWRPQCGEGCVSILRQVSYIIPREKILVPFARPDMQGSSTPRKSTARVLAAPRTHDLQARATAPFSLAMHGASRERKLHWPIQ